MRILSLFYCNLDSIIHYLPEIKRQGFDAIQISPLQNTKDDSSNEWWMLYQPINFNIGNRMGNKDSLKRLCDEAHKNGLIVVADAVINHLASENNTGSLIPHPLCDRDILNNPDCFKERRNIDNWDDRYQVTHYCMSLPGLNPGNKLVQEKIIGMLNDYISCGVGGFRFDAAKSIALPEEGCDFFSNVTYSMNKWLDIIYGEVLFSDKELIKKYAKYMKVLTNSDAYNNCDIIKFVENKDSYLSKDLGYTKDTRTEDINAWYSSICSHYPNTLYYARNFTHDWNSWRNNEIKEANMKLRLRR
jgi:alpha-amylase